jgi:hypothetical protein
MADYSKMTYEELRRIADNDAIADLLSEEEYESLSVAMWKRFGAEKLIQERPLSGPPAPSRPALHRIPVQMRQ